MKHEYRKVGGDIFTFSTGRELSPCLGVVGLSTELELYEGYDDRLCFHDDIENPDLTPVERVELADYMIALWQRFKDAS